MSKDHQLSDEHLRMLRDESVISDECIKARGYRTITDTRELVALGFATKQQLVPGLWMPGHAPDGSNSFGTFRPDFPRQARNSNGKPTNKAIKYEMPKGADMRLDVPPLCHDKSGDPSIPAWITEGIKKADSLASQGLFAVCLYGVWNFKGKNAFGGVTTLADFDYIAWNERDTYIVFDSDVMHKPEVRKALERLTEILQRKGAHVSHVYLPGGRDNKVGVDDYLREHSVDDLRALIDAPRAVPQAAPPIFELLDAPPPAQRRPLQLINGRAYAAAWPYVRKTERERTNAKTGEIIKLNPPVITTDRQLMIVRDDGATFGACASHPFSDLGFDVVLPEIPPDKSLWRSPSITAFVKGRRANAVDIFQRISEVIDRFMDFDRSLAEQAVMCEMVACYILSTWFLDAFTVIGFIWPNGEKGCGKTQLLTLIADLSYLGQLILAGGSFAALRDLADYGAFLGFDDAENLSDPKQTDPDKRTLLLAGNRRGNTIPLKEPIPGERAWRTRHVNTFCPRGFSAIRTPDDILSSRTIIAPLIRTANRQKANTDPSDYRLWPHDRSTLIDDLWSLSLVNLVALSDCESQVNERASLTGRPLEPFRALLSVAFWLDSNGIDGLWQRMNTLSLAYQGERRRMETGDLTTLILQSILKLALPDIWDVKDVKNVWDVKNEIKGEWFLHTERIAETAREIAGELEADINLERITPRNIGRTIRKLRAFKSDRAAGTRRHGWRINGQDLARFAISYNILQDGSPILTEQTSQTSQTSQIREFEKDSGDTLGDEIYIPPGMSDEEYEQRFSTRRITAR